MSPRAEVGMQQRRSTMFFKRYGDAACCGQPSLHLACPSLVSRLGFPFPKNVRILSTRTLKSPAHQILAPSFLGAALWLPDYVLIGPEQQ